MKIRSIRISDIQWDKVKKQAKKKNVKCKDTSYSASDYIRDALDEKFAREGVKCKTN